VTVVLSISDQARHQWLTRVILATQEAEIRRIEVQSQPRQTDNKTLSQKNHHKKRAGGVAEGVGPEFKTPVQKKKKILTKLVSFSLSESWNK
jgi:hypothetical protein